MPRFTPLLMVGGPYDGWGQGIEDGFLDKGQKHVIMGPPTGSDIPAEVIYVYVRDPKPYPDGRVRWHYDPMSSRELALEQQLIKPDEMKATPEGLEEEVLRVELTKNPVTGRWELFVNGKKEAEAAPDEIQSKDDAEAFRAKHVPGKAQAVNSH